MSEDRASVESMSTSDEHPSRKRSYQQSPHTDLPHEGSTKRRKCDGHQHPPDFWNALSKVILTRRALREFDRRTSKHNTANSVYSSTGTRLLRSDTRPLAQFAQGGGPDMSHLRNHAGKQPSAASATGSTSRRGSKRSRDSGLPDAQPNRTSTTGPYDPQFEQMLIDHGVHPPGRPMKNGTYPPEPENFDELLQMLSRRRPSLSATTFSREQFITFRNATHLTRSETGLISSVIPTVAGAEDKQHELKENKIFTNLEKFADGLKMASPDKFYGARPSQIELAVRRDLSGYIIPSKDTSLPAAPNFFFEGKGESGRPDVAMRQVMHDNACGARAIFQLQNYKRETPLYDGNAYTIGCYYSDGQLKLFATHPGESEAHGTEYYTTQLDTYGLTGNVEAFRKGATAYRNARDFAREQRERFIAQANAACTASSTRANTSSGSTGNRTGISRVPVNSSFKSDTSADELAGP